MNVKSENLVMLTTMFCGPTIMELQNLVEFSIANRVEDFIHVCQESEFRAEDESTANDIEMASSLKRKRNDFQQCFMIGDGEEFNGETVFEEMGSNFVSLEEQYIENPK